MYYDEPGGCDGDMRQYEGLDMSEFQPPTDEEYRAAYAEYLKEEAEKDGASMKIESCPKCGKTPLAEHIKTRPIRHKWKMRQKCYCSKCLMGASRTFTAFKWLSESKWNRWARRERRRMKKEEAGK